MNFISPEIARLNLAEFMREALAEAERADLTQVAGGQQAAIFLKPRGNQNPLMLTAAGLTGHLV